MRISVVIPVYNEEKFIEGCLKSIVNQTEKPDEIIVVNNNCTDKTIAIIKKKFPEITIVKETTQGMIPARNSGFSKAKGDIIARTDADSRVPLDWISRIKKHFQNDKTLLGLSGPTHFYDIPNLVQYENWPIKLYNKSYINNILKHDGLLGPNMALRKKTWNLIKNEVCLSDKDVHEDIDLSIHLAEHGKILFEETLIVEASFRRWKKLKPYFEYNYRYVKTIEKHKKWLARLKQKALKPSKTLRVQKVKKFLQKSLHLNKQ